MPVSGGDRLRERVEGARVDVACLQDDDGRGSIWDLAQGVRQGGRADAALVVGFDRLRRAEAEVAQGQVNGVVTLRADEHPDARRPG